MKGRVLFVSLIILTYAGCATYTTPGGSVSLSEMADPEINEILATEPAASFPVNIAVARVQAPHYQSYRVNSYGTGRYSVVTNREVETEEDFEKISHLPQVSAVGPLNRILLPERLDSINALRGAAARLKADVLLIYTFDTTFHAGEQKFAPLNAISLGFLKNKEVTVTTTASAAIFDVRTEYLYGLAEATQRESKWASVWGTSSVIDDLRILTERHAFEGLLVEIDKTWRNIIREYASGDN